MLYRGGRVISNLLPIDGPECELFEETLTTF